MYIMKTEDIKKYSWIILLIIALIIVDQSTKIIIQQKLEGQDILIIEGMLKFNYTKNEGIAFSVEQDSITSIITDIIILAMVIRFMVIQRDKMYKITQISLSLILAGGIGNLIDRIFKGGVIDFIDISLLIPNFPIFNLADIFVIVGFIAFAITVAVNLFSLRKGEIEIQNEQTDNSK